MTFANTYKIPTYAICYIEYGDINKLEEPDVEQIDNFIRTNFPNGFIVYWKDENPYFSSTPAFGKATEVVDADFYYL